MSTGEFDHNGIEIMKMTPAVFPVEAPPEPPKDQAVALGEELLKFIKTGRRKEASDLLQSIKEGEQTADSPGLLARTLAFTDSEFEATLVHWAVLYEKPDILEWLLDAGAPVDQACGKRSQMTPLHWACTKPSIEVLETLISRGADLESLDEKQVLVGN